MTERRRELLVSAAFALWGLTLAIALYAVWERPAQPGQLPGLGTRLNYDARAPFRFVFGLMLLPIFFGAASRPLARRLAAANAWARNTTLIAPLVALWFVTLSRDWKWTLWPYAVVIAIAFVLRHRALHFTRNDAVLFPTLLSSLLAVHDVSDLPIDRALVVSLLIVFIVRVAIGLIPREIPPGLAFVAAPLGLVLQTSFFARDQRYFGWHALALVIVTPFVLRLVLRNARAARAVLVTLVYPLSIYAYINATSIQTAEGKPRVNFFEESHSLLPASEYQRGERPYRDILPAHGLLEDGFFDYLVMLVADDNIGRTWRARLTIGTLNAAAMYALAIAATGSAEAGLFAGFFALLTGVFTPGLRALPALITMALIVGAVRRRRPRWLMFAGFGTVICGLTSLDFAAYTFVTLLVAIARLSPFSPPRGEKVPEGRMRGGPHPALRATLSPQSGARAALIGIAAAVVPLFLVFAFFGILDDFFYGTFVEVLSLGPAYTLTTFAVPPALQNIRSFPEVLAGLFHRDSYLYLLWAAVAVFVGASIGRRPRRRVEPFVLMGVWMVLAAISYAERHHLYFDVIAPAFVVCIVYLLIRRRHALAIPAALTLLILASPTTHLGVISGIRDARGPVEPNWVEVNDVPRARGALFQQEDAHAIAGVKKYIALTLGPDETFLDFTNRGLFYFLFRRDCPVREYEVAFYEPEARQRDVIARIEQNPRVRAVLLPGPSGRFTVDGLTNEQRAPLVWQYIQTHFHPDFAEGDVVFWRRNR